MRNQHCERVAKSRLKGGRASRGLLVEPTSCAARADDGAMTDRGRYKNLDPDHLGSGRPRREPCRSAWSCGHEVARASRYANTQLPTVSCCTFILQDAASSSRREDHKKASCLSQHVCLSHESHRAARGIQSMFIITVFLPRKNARNRPIIFRNVHLLRRVDTSCFPIFSLNSC